MTEAIFFDLIKLSPAFAILAWFVWYLMQRNEKKDERVNEMHREVVEIINEIKNEMKEMSKEQQKDFINVINMMHTALTNNTIALNEMKNAIEKSGK